VRDDLACMELFFLFKEYQFSDGAIMVFTNFETESGLVEIRN
jgi:hypothetical protein